MEAEEGRRPSGQPPVAGVLLHRRWLGLATVLVLLVVVGAVVRFQGREAAVYPDLVVSTTPLEPGAASTMGALVIRYPDGQDIEILAVDATVSDNVEVIGALAAFPIPRNGYNLVQAHGGSFPPSLGHLDESGVDMEYVPATGRTFRWSEVGPDDYQGQIEVLIGVRVTNGGHGAVNGVAVTYRTGGTVQHEFFPWALVMCIGPDECLNPEEALEELDLVPPR